MKSTKLALSAAMISLVFGGANARAADRYNLKIETGLVITEACVASDGQNQTSHIELLIDDSKASDPKELTTAVARIRVCSPFSSPVRENVPMPIPIGLMRQISQMAVGKTTTYDVPVKKFQGYFTKETPPNTLIAEKTHDGVLQLTYVDKSSNAVKIGPIRVFLGGASRLASVKGFSADKHLPISRIEVEVRDKGVTLDANLTAVDTSK